MYCVYPVSPTPFVCDDYSVKINGSPVALNSARVSAVPFNRRWPGHQRQIEQTELINFLSLATDEPLHFEITPKEEFSSVVIRPRSLGITPEISDGKICFTLERPSYFTVEAFGRNRALHVFADPVKDYGVDPEDPEVLYFGPGEHDVGQIDLKSNQTLYLEEGAVVYACIRAMDAENIRILGRGILDNSRNKEVILFEANAYDNHEAIPNAKRQHTVQLEYCTNVEIDGITIRDSLVYNVRPLACEHLKIKNVKIIGCWRFNSDGIDMHNCIDVHISQCFLRTYDDCICVKGFDCYYEGTPEEVAAQAKAAMNRNGKCYETFRDVLVEDCVLWNDWGKCLEIGAETKAEEIKNITFRNCQILHVTGIPLDCMNVDYAHVHHVVYEDITVDCDEVIPMPVLQKSDEECYENPREDYMPSTINVSVVYHHEYSKGSEAKRGKNSDFLFRNIHVLGDKMPRVKMVGHDKDHQTKNVRIENLTLNGVPVKELSGKHWQVNEFCENISLEG